MKKPEDWVLPLHVDAAAFIVTGQGFVLDHTFEVVAEYDTIEEAEAVVAKANGVNVETQRRWTVEEAQARHQYLDNLKAASRRRKAEQ